MASTHPSSMLAESLAVFSKAAHQAVSILHMPLSDGYESECMQFAEVEGQSRSEVARAVAETREMRVERDKAFKDLHTAHLETQSWKQEASTSKAAVRSPLMIAWRPCIHRLIYVAGSSGTYSTHLYTYIRCVRCIDIPPLDIPPGRNPRHSRRQHCSTPERAESLERPITKLARTFLARRARKMFSILSHRRAHRGTAPGNSKIYSYTCLFCLTYSSPTHSTLVQRPTQQRYSRPRNPNLITPILPLLLRL